MENELEELKELSIAKIKVAYNRSIDLEAIHSVLWDRIDKIMTIKIIVVLILSLTTTSLLLLAIFLGIITALEIYITLLVLTITFIIIWDFLYKFTGNSKDHGHLVSEALRLRDYSMSFLQYKLDNLDKQGYIDELKSLEIKDSSLKEKSVKYARKLSSGVKSRINQKLEELKRLGIKKYFVTQEEIDSATEKLQKYKALRTGETYIKFA